MRQVATLAFDLRISQILQGQLDGTAPETTEADQAWKDAQTLARKELDAVMAMLVHADKELLTHEVPNEGGEDAVAKAARDGAVLGTLMHTIRAMLVALYKKDPTWLIRHREPTDGNVEVAMLVPVDDETGRPKKDVSGCRL